MGNIGKKILWGVLLVISSLFFVAAIGSAITSCSNGQYDLVLYPGATLGALVAVVLIGWLSYKGVKLSIKKIKEN